MRVLFDICHPAFVHFFKHAIGLLRRDGHEVLVAARDKEVTLELLAALDIPHVSLGRRGRGLTGLAGEWALRNWRMLRLARRFRPDVLVGVSGASIGPAGAVLRLPRLVLDESESARVQRWLGLPLATAVWTGTGYLHDLGPRQVRFRGVWVQAYLHPDRFRPDPAALRDAGVDPGRPYLVLRTVAWSAAHDVGRRGAGRTALGRAVERLSRHGRVLISSEAPLPDDLADLASPVPPERIHDLLALARLYVGEGATMAAEAAVLGTPAVFCSPLRPGYIRALEHRHGLLRTARALAEGVAVAEQLLARPDLPDRCRANARRLWSESEDIPDFLYRQIVAAAGR